MLHSNFSKRICISKIELFNIDWTTITFPLFFRFDTVVLKLNYEKSTRTFDEMGQYIKKHLQQLIRPLHGSKLEFDCDHHGVDHPDEFISNDGLLMLLREDILPSCYACRSYCFTFSFTHREGQNLIAKILQLEPIVRCADVAFNIDIYGDYNAYELPEEEITSWLISRNCTCSTERNAYGQRHKERTLSISCSTVNGSELLDRLKMVIVCVGFLV